MINWKKNDAALVQWGGEYILCCVLFVTEDGYPVCKLGLDYVISETADNPQWHKAGHYTPGFWGWRLND